jgi:hypothetical protein|tara:strand:+ start:483 stop:746 length:264 start_codon:yes stop_codon:yes gene_type:complete
VGIAQEDLDFIYAAREAELGVTPAGVKVLHSCATQYGYIADERGVIDPDTGQVMTDPDKLAPIIERGKTLMRVTSQTGENLIRALRA